MKKFYLTCIMTILFVILSFTNLVFAETKYITPEGYSDNDYQKLVTFLEIKNDSGIKNGTALNSDESIFIGYYHTECIE